MCYSLLEASNALAFEVWCGPARWGKVIFGRKERRSAPFLCSHQSNLWYCLQATNQEVPPMPDSSYYASAAWRRKRQERLDFDDHQCQGCGINRHQLEELGWPSLQVHHKNAGPPDFLYPSFGNEQMSDLLTLCSKCHDGITNSVRDQRFKLDPRKKLRWFSLLHLLYLFPF